MKSMSRVALVQPHPPSSVGAIHPPMGLGYLVETLERDGVQVSVLDRAVMSRREVLHRLSGDKVDFIGFSLFSYRLTEARRLVSQARASSRDAIFVAGGPHVSLLREAVFGGFPELDYIIVHEGETPLRRLCSGEDASKIQRVLARGSSQTETTSQVEETEDINQLPFPRYRLVDLRRYSSEIPILTSRGCPYHCTFCSSSAIWGNKLRCRSAASVVEEIQHWHDLGRRQFAVYDDNFTFHRERVLAICEGLQRRGLKDLSFRCPNGVRADRLDRELLMVMWNAGFRSLAIGVESGSQSVLDAMRKGESLESMEQTIRTCCEIGYDVTLFFLIGTPGETCEDVRKSFALAERYPVSRVKFQRLIPYPGTDLYRQITDGRGRLMIPPAIYLDMHSHFGSRHVFDTPELPLSRRHDLMKEARRVEERVLRRTIRSHLGRYGVLSKPLARVLSSGIGTWAIAKHPWLRRYVMVTWQRLARARTGRRAWQLLH